MLKSFLTITICLYLFLLSPLVFAAQATATHSFMTDRTTTLVSDGAKPLGSNKTIQAFGTTTAGAGAATIAVQVSNDCSTYVTIDTLSLTLGTTATSDYYEGNTSWKCVRTHLSAISGTGAKVTVIMGVDLE